MARCVLCGSSQSKKRSIVSCRLPSISLAVLSTIVDIAGRYYNSLRARHATFGLSKRFIRSGCSRRARAIPSAHPDATLEAARAAMAEGKQRESRSVGVQVDADKRRACVEGGGGRRYQILRRRRHLSSRGARRDRDDFFRGSPFPGNAIDSCRDPRQRLCSPWSR